MTLREDIEVKEEKTTIRPKKEIILSEEEQETASKNIEEFLNELKKELPEDTQYSIKKDKTAIYVEINSPNLGFLIGYRGETLYAFQNILTAVAGKGLEIELELF